jgi:glutamate-ammonia-ligase adenylyltransferase
VARERWGERAAEIDDGAVARRARALLDDPDFGPLAEAAMGSSPFLTECLLADLPFALRLAEDGPDLALKRVFIDLAGVDCVEEQSAIMRRLRIARRRAALSIGLADVSGAWPLAKVTDALSRLADVALNASVAFLLRQAARGGRLPLADRDDILSGCGYAVIAMGKLGASELNYSSDIDLMVLFDSERPEFAAIDDLQVRFVRLTREWVKMLEERTADGYVFRTDLRLRPDPAATPIALSVAAAEVYYESLGQNWERAALIKARPAAGDIALGERFLKSLRPFIWRRHLDFAAIQDIHSIKRQIHAHRGGRDIAVLGHNLKVGRGGIREIEFFAQTQQLIWGGRLPDLRVTGTEAALEGLVAAGRVTAATADDLIDAYRYLRRVEHRLQMIADAQTQTLPDDEAGLEHLACFLGYPSAPAFGEALVAVLRRVESHYARLFEGAPSLSGPGNLVFTGTEDDPGTVETLRRLGYRDPSMVCASIRGWHHGRYRAMRSERARQLLTELMPAIVGAFGKTPDPDSSFLRFDAFLGKLPAGVQVFSLFHSNPSLLELVAELMGAAPNLADALERQPSRLDALIAASIDNEDPSRDVLAAELRSQLAQVDHYEGWLDVSRRWTEDRKFRVGSRIFRGLTDADAAGSHLSDLADLSVSTLLQRISHEFEKQHGRVPNAGMTVLALGKLGGREMTVASDLDLVFVYDAAVDVESDGPKPLQAGAYFGRLSQRLIAGLTAQTGEGVLYDVDMRLRPSGTKGPIASNLDGYRRYHAESAWTWEHMALTRARAIAGPTRLKDAATSLVREVLCRRRDPEKLLADVADMRERIAKEHKSAPIWDVKQWRGGLVDVEFIAQYLQLRHASERPTTLETNTTRALAAAAEAGILPADAATELIEATRLWRRLQGMLRLISRGDFDDKTASDGVRRALTRAGQIDDFAQLRPKMEATYDRVSRHYRRLIGEPATRHSDRAAS